MPVPSRATLQRIEAEITALEHDEHDGVIQLARGIAIRITHPGRVLFPDAGVTKGEVVRYYVRVAPFLLPLLADRPLSLKRFPEGVRGEFFFQQKAPPRVPRGVRTETVEGPDGDAQERLVGGALATLLYCVQIGAFECNPWHSRVGSLAHPDYTVIDLDPGPRATFARVVETARRVRDALDAAGLSGVCKTSGATGIHIYVPLPARTTETTAAHVAEVIARAVVATLPKSTTVTRSIRDRGPSTIYVDYGQNARGKTIAAAYGVRARDGAPVSTPLAWDELVPGLDPREFTVRTVPDRLARVGDLWGPALRKRNPSQIVTRL